MNYWKHIYFFDKNGKYFNFDYDDSNDMWSGDIYLPQVSTGLFEVGQIFILQEFIQESTGLKTFGYPHSRDDDNCNWVVKWETEDPIDIFLFQFDTNFDTGTQSSLVIETPGPPLLKYDEIYIPLKYDTSQTINEDSYIVTNLIGSEAVQINVTINSNEENTFKRTLIINDECTGTIIGKFTVYAETISEDERLKVMTENFGHIITADDSLIFRDTNVYEKRADFIELNRKRKELIMEGHNIYPFIGSYKGLINAIKFFGYNNVQVKEFWKNINKSSPTYGKHIQSNPIGLFNPQVNYNDMSITLPNKNFRKTSMFSLIYRINKVKDGLFDFQDLPFTEEVFDFTIEEVLIKLFGLKRKLEKEFLPLNAHIKDIVGEADFFGLTNLTNTISRNDKRNINVGIPVDFKVSPGNCAHLEDLRNFSFFCFKQGAVIGQATIDFCNAFLNPFVIGGGVTGSETNGQGTLRNLVLGPYNQNTVLPQVPIGPDINSVLGKPVSGENFTITEISDVFMSYFSRYSPNLNKIGTADDGYSSLYLPDKPNIPVGALVLLENNTFGNITWDDIDLTYDQVSNANTLHTFDLNPQGASPGDVFSINDPITNTGASYEVQIGDTDTTVRNELFEQLQTLKNGFSFPWLHLDISKINLTIGGDAIRVFGTNTQNLQVNVNKTPVSGAVFNKLDNPGELLYTWGSIRRGNFSEIEWIIAKEKTDISPEFFYSARGPLSQLESLPLTLPFVGDYSVELRLYDLYNNISSIVKLDGICVEGKEVEYSGWYQARKAAYSWVNEGKYKWNDYGSTWNLPIEPSTTWEEETPSLYESLDSVNAILNNFGLGVSPNFTLLNFQNDGKASFTGPYFWNNLKEGRWNDTYHLWWDLTAVTGDTPAFFQFSTIIPNTYLKIIDTNDNVGIFYIDESTTTLAQAAAKLNLSKDPILNKYVYSVVYDAASEQKFVQAVSRYFGSYGDFSFVDIVDIDDNRVCDEAITGCESLIYKKGLHRSSNPSWVTAKFINDGVTLPKLTWIMFVYDKCKIKGKDKARWSIKNTTDPTMPDIYFESKYLTYLFQKPGKYEIGLELIDSNGNKYKKERNILIIK
jgi:hypothetical protein